MNDALHNTDRQYDAAVQSCREIFLHKIRDYGTSWRILRTSSLTDQIFIKAQRIRTIQETGVSRVEESVADAFRGIVNYAIIALIQLGMRESDPMQLGEKEVMQHFDEQAARIKSLMEAKNHDYGEAWRDMRIASFTDLILMKIMRVKQIEEHEGKTEVSEGPAAHYMDMANYAIFALIKLSEHSEA